MKWLPVSARRLQQRTLRSSTQRLRGAAVYPFFDRDGQVPLIMIVIADAPDIHLLPWSPELIRVPLFGNVRLTGDLLGLPHLGEADTATIAALWHYDPRWLLNDKRFAGHWAVDLIKSTNCADCLNADIKRLYFRSDLSKLVGVFIKMKSETQWLGWRPYYLPGKAIQSAAPAPADRTPPWRFDPIWSLWTPR